MKRCRKLVRIFSAWSLLFSGMALLLTPQFRIHYPLLVYLGIGNVILAALLFSEALLSCPHQADAAWCKINHGDRVEMTHWPSLGTPIRVVK